MLNNLEEVRKRLEIIKNLIPGFETEERKEIKKNNKLIEELKKELTIYKDLIFNELIEKKEKSLPKDEPIEIKENEDKLNKLLENINLLSNKDYLSKLDFNKNIYDIENSGNLNIINETLKEILNKFKLINVLLTKEDFKYSVTLYKYMSCYFENIEKSDFDIIMKDIFDSLYWENPNLILHLSLNLRDLVSKYKKQFESYIKNITSDKGLKSSVRVGFLVQGNDPTSTPTTARALANGTTTTQTIWEPNADVHTEYATNMSGASGVMAYMGGKAAATDPVAMTNTTNFETVTAGTHNLKTSTEATKYPAGTIFSFQAGITKVRVYVWLEGQDIDNEDTASLGTGVGVKLNFKLAD